MFYWIMKKLNIRVKFGLMVANVNSKWKVFKIIFSFDC